jgi:hypothetical protein
LWIASGCGMLGGRTRVLSDCAMTRRRSLCLCGILLNRQRHSLCVVNLKWGHLARLLKSRLPWRIRKAEKESSRVHCAISLSKPPPLHFSYLIPLSSFVSSNKASNTFNRHHLNLPPETSIHLHPSTLQITPNSETTGVE